MYHSLSYYKINKKWKIQRRKKKNTSLNYPKLQNGDETTLKHCISSALKVQGVFIDTRGKGGQGANPGPKYGRGRACTAAKMRQKPRFHGFSRATRCPVCLLRRQRLISVFSPWFWQNSSPRSMAILQAFNHSLNGDLGSSSSLHTMDLETCKRGVY